MKPKKPKCEHLHPAGRLMFGRCGSCGKMVDETKTKRKPKRKPSDNEMLDWLEDKKVTPYCWWQSNGKRRWSVNRDYAHPSYKNLRSAIRAAMKAEVRK